MAKDSELVQRVESTLQQYSTARTKFEKTWYDNLFFDDGKHYRFYSQRSQRIVDLAANETLYNPMRAIPKASRQIRGIANMLLSNPPRWTTIPEAVFQDDFEGDAQAFQQAMQKYNSTSTRTNHYLDEIYEKGGLRPRMGELVLLGLKMPVSFIEIAWDKRLNIPKYPIWDAFDIYVSPEVTELHQSPALIKTVRRTLHDIKQNPSYNNTDKIAAETKYAQSDAKSRYQMEKFGYTQGKSDHDSFAIVREGWFKERDKDGSMKLRLLTTAAGTLLRNELVELPDYPFSAWRPFPGPFYQPAWIERFIPLNKSLDNIYSKMERFVYTMVVGRILRQKGSDVSNISNQDGTFVDYSGTPPSPMQIPPLPNSIFAFTQNLNQLIEEQGVSTSVLGKVPRGIRANKAIDNLKQSEFANLRLPFDQLEACFMDVANKTLDRAAMEIKTPQNVYRLNDTNQPDFFKVIGEQGAKAYQEAGVPLPPNVTILKSSYEVRVSLEDGLSYTQEGKKATLMDLWDKQIIKDPAVILEAFKFGNIGEIIARNEQQSSAILDHPEFQQIEQKDPEIGKMMRAAIALSKGNPKVATQGQDQGQGGGK